jgi:uncharacterized membrane protein (DUF2068 family)
MKRPLIVTSLTIGVLIFTVDHLVRAYQAVRQWELLSALPLSVPLVYLAGTGLFWGMAGLVLAVGLWQAKTWSFRGVVLLVLAYAAYDGLDRFFLARSPARQASWPFSLILTLVILILILWIRSRSPVKSYFGVLHDRQPENK